VIAGWYDTGDGDSRMKKGFAVCLRSEGFGASLEVRKLYPFINDPDAEVNKLIRVVDESGADYLYPTRWFRKLALPSDVRRAIRMACSHEGAINNL
jgi:hypothetical protein